MRFLTRIASAVGLVVLLLFSQAWADDCGDDELVTRQIAMELVRGSSPDDLTAPPPFTVLDRIPEYQLWLIEVPEGTDTEQVAEELEEGQTLVNRAEPLRLLETPEGVQRSIPDLGIAFDKTGYVGQTTLQQINAPQAVQQFSGAGIIVAVLDTGIALQHPELAGAIVVPGADFAGGDGTAAAQPNGVDDDGDGDVDESVHHGTFVAGLIRLVAPDARILPIRVLEADGKGTAFGVAKGILHAMRNGADVINLSLAMGLESRAVEIAIEDARDRGVVVVAAAGNRGSACVDFPADLGETIAVASVDGNFIKTIFSSFGTQVDLSAPALDLLSTFGDDEFAQWSGTSFATPLVSGGVALLLEKYPGLTVDDVRDVIQTTVQPDNNSGLVGLMGAGALDLDAMAQVLTSDRTSLKLSAAPQGTTLDWSPVLDAMGYDVVRGEVAGLDSVELDTGEEIVILPSLTCMAEDTAATDTAMVPDALLPAPGTAFFYLFRDDAPDGGAYGSGADDHRRIVGGLDCLLGGGG